LTAAHNDTGAKAEATTIIRSLLMEIRLIPQDDALVIELVRKLAGLLALSEPQNETSRPKAACSTTLVAGVRNQRLLRLVESALPRLVA